ncbi:hypothetical protein MK851_05515 [Tenacibaculum sp. 1B UA]|uniref:hypothetical protein n=1 Tax=Tenacibaculum sp. 1B UA TaxID=2922252 RepID=UPI002A241812|nr:hypothetical protein [Tenacibaculum sp. 1B UA]MDX8553084.1 hypothetical protein [Tenacibaculum sp. 1B UA]
MRTLITQFLLLYLLSSNISYSQELHTRNTNWKKENLKKHVKSYTETSNVAIKKNGNIIQSLEKTYSSGKEKFVFNKQGSLTEIFFHRYSSKVPYRQWTFNYDKQGNQIKFRECEINIQLPEKCITSKYVYKKTGNQTEIKLYEIREFFPEADDGEYVHKKWIYTYNTKGYLIKAKEYLGKKNLKETISYTYDSENNLIEENHVYNGKEHSKNTFKYDRKNNVVEQKYWCEDKDLNKTITYSYDDKDNVIAEIFSSYTGNKIYKKNTYKYKYDRNENWKERIKYKNSVPIQVSKRIYKYFD